jgi:hypothetical protein
MNDVERDSLLMRHASEMELLQTRILRMLRDQDMMLGDAIHAHVDGRDLVVLEFMARVQAAIQKEINLLVDRNKVPDNDLAEQIQEAIYEGDLDLAGYLIGDRDMNEFI